MLFYTLFGVSFSLAIPSIGNMLHLTDLHVDPYYLEGADVANSCHAPVSSSARLTRRNGVTPAGRFGTPSSNCDSSPELVNATFGFLKQVVEQTTPIDFVIWTGDNARHDSDKAIPRTWQEIQDQNTEMVQAMKDTFPSIPILPNIGNNDMYPHDTLPYTPSVAVGTYEFYANLWSDFIPTDQVATFKTLGSFIVNLRPGLVGVSLNTMYFANFNTAVTHCSDASSAGQALITWLDSVLTSAKANGQNVYISGHVPPSNINYFPTCYQMFSSLMTKYSDIVTGHFYGHVNLDQYYFPSTTFDPPAKTSSEKSPAYLSTYFDYLVSFNDGAATSAPVPFPILVAPSVIPVHNPSLRVLKYSTTNGALTGYDQYYCDLAKWNTVQGAYDVTLFYELEYSTSAYDMTGLSTSDWMDLAHRAQSNSSSSSISGKTLRDLMSNHLVVSLTSDF